MSVNPDSDMFSPDSPQVNEAEAVSEITADLKKIEVPEDVIGDVITTLTDFPDSVYHSYTATLDYSVMRGLNGRFLLTTKPRPEKS